MGSFNNIAGSPELNNMKAKENKVDTDKVSADIQPNHASDQSNIQGEIVPIKDRYKNFCLNALMVKFDVPQGTQINITYIKDASGLYALLAFRPTSYPMNYVSDIKNEDILFTELVILLPQVLWPDKVTEAEGFNQADFVAEQLECYDEGFRRHMKLASESPSFGDLLKEAVKKANKDI